MSLECSITKAIMEFTLGAPVISLRRQAENINTAEVRM